MKKRKMIYESIYLSFFYGNGERESREQRKYDGLLKFAYAESSYYLCILSLSPVYIISHLMRKK